MPATAIRELRKGDIVEIVQHDERCRMHLRRVQIVSVVKKHNHYEVLAGNLHNENVWDYQLDLEPWEKIITKPGNIGWFYFENDPEFDG